jgi:hypothetical protein
MLAVGQKRGFARGAQPDGVPVGGALFNAEVAVRGALFGA